MGLLESVSLWAVMFVEVMLLKSRSPQYSQKTGLTLGVVVVAIGLTATTLRSYYIWMAQHYNILFVKSVN